MNNQNKFYFFISFNGNYFRRSSNGVNNIIAIEKVKAYFCR